MTYKGIKIMKSITHQHSIRNKYEKIAYVATTNVLEAYAS